MHAHASCMHVHTCSVHSHRTRMLCARTLVPKNLDFTFFDFYLFSFTYFTSVCSIFHMFES